MQTLFKIALVAVAVVAGIYFAYTWAFPTGTLRYRMTVVVEVDGKVYSGSSVVEARFEMPPQILSTTRVRGTLRGEATVIDLGSRGPLFTLLTGPIAENGREYFDDPESIAVRAFFGTSIGGLAESTIRGMSRTQMTKDLDNSLLPMMVRFENTANPKSVEWVRPADFSATYGPDSRLVRVTLETTDDPITTGISEQLPWLIGSTWYLGGATRDRDRPEKNLTGNQFLKGTTISDAR